MSIVSQPLKKNQPERALGIYTVNSAPLKTKGCRPVSQNSIYEFLDTATGELIDFRDPQFARIERFLLQEIAKEILPKKHRIQGCMEFVVSDADRQRGRDKAQGKKVGKRRLPIKDSPNVDIIKHATGKCSYKGLVQCGGVWTCPVCSSKVGERRKEELKQVTEGFLGEELREGLNRYVVMGSHTFPHARGDVLKDIIGQLNKAYDSFTQSSPIRKGLLKKGINICHKVRVLEVTYGDQNGWHPHHHVLYFIESELEEWEVLNIFRPVGSEAWKDALIRKGLLDADNIKQVADTLVRGFDVRSTYDATAYVTKYGRSRDENAWTIYHEMTKANQKSGIKKPKKGYHPFDLLRLYFMTGEAKWKMLFIEFIEAFYRKNQISYSRELKKLYSIDDSLQGDEALAAISDEEAELFYSITFADWRKVLHHRYREYVLRLFESSKQEGIDFIKNLKRPYKKKLSEI